MSVSQLIVIRKEESVMNEKLESLRQLFLGSYLIKEDSLDLSHDLTLIKEKLAKIYEKRIEIISKVGNN